MSIFCIASKEADKLRLRRKHKIMSSFERLGRSDPDKQNINEDMLGAVEGMILGYQTLTTGSKAIEGDVLRIDEPLNKAEEFIDAVVGKDKNGRTKKEFTEKELQLLAIKVRDYTKRMISVGLDPHTTFEEGVVATGYIQMAKRMYGQHRGDFGIGAKFPKLLQSFVVNRARFFRKFEPAAEIMHKRDMLKQYMLSGRTNIINNVQELIKNQSNKYRYDHKVINELLPLLNGYNGRPKESPSLGANGETIKILSERAIRNNKIILNEFREKLLEYEDVDDSNVDKVTEDFLSMKAEWDNLNYGEEYMKGLRDTPDPGSHISFYNNALKLYTELYQERLKYSSTNVGVYEIDEMETRLAKLGEAGFRYKQGYVPGQGDFNLDVVSYSDFSSKFPRMATILNKQDSNVERHDFMNSFIDGIMDFTYKLETVGQLTALGAMDGALNKYAKWNAQNVATSSILRHYTTKMWEYITYQKKGSDTTEIVRNLFHPLSMVSGPMMLLYPASGITNILAGRLMINLKYGKELKTVKDIYRKALNDEDNPDHSVAVAVDNIARKFYLNVGSIQDFQIQKTTSNKEGKVVLDFSRDVRNLIMSIADVTTRKGLLGILGITEKFSLKNSEELFLRNTIAPLLFDQAQIEVSVMKENNSLPKDKSIHEVVSGILNRTGGNIAADLNEALGQFDQDNKPFWSWMNVHSDNPAKVVIGSLLNVWYMFRHVGVNNTYMMKDVAVEVNPFSNKQGKRNILYRDYLSRLDTPGSGGLFIVLALASYRAIGTMLGLFTGDRGEFDQVSSLARNLNPLQEIQTFSELIIALGAKGALMLAHKANFAPLLNLSVNEAEFNYIVRDNISLAGGVLAGGALEDIMQNKFDESPIFETMLNNVVDSYNSIYDATSASSYIERRQAVHNILNNPIPLINYSNDYLAFASNVFLQLSDVTTDPSKAKYDKIVKNRDKGKFISSIIGANYYAHPATWGKAKLGGAYKFNYALERERLIRERTGFSDLHEEMFNQMVNYQRVYITSMLQKMSLGE